MMSDKLTICWFRQDLRITDNPALFYASNIGRVIPVYILDEHSSQAPTLGSCSKLWLHHSLSQLSHSLNNRLLFFSGNPLHILKEIIQRYQVTHLHWNRCYEPWAIQRDKEIKSHLADIVTIKSFNASLLWEPWNILNSERIPYAVFTAYQKACNRSAEPRKTLPPPDGKNVLLDIQANDLSDLNLMPASLWSDTVCSHWEFGEVAAGKMLDIFISEKLSRYLSGRDCPADNSVSRLSPHLHFGEISPHQIYWALGRLEQETNQASYQRQLIWREFAYYLLYHHPQMWEQNLRVKFDRFPWQNDESLLQKWRQGQTGVPMVDAGMRELWQTGYMHNRVRMICASFLVKNLLVDWKHGAAWFWDCLFDADLANNSSGWQWVAGSGVEAAPYFRIFNPVLQGQKFDPEGNYIRQFVPELEKLPATCIHSPWLASSDLLRQAGITLGVNYPSPIVDLKLTRERALQAFNQLKYKI